MRIARGLDFDVMLEAKAKDLALIQLRTDLLRYAPDVAARFGLHAAQAEALEQEKAALVEEQPEHAAWSGMTPLHFAGGRDANYFRLADA